MKSTNTLIFILLVISSGNAQDMYTDPRDGQEYRYGKIQETVWMLDNLNYKSGMSLEVDQSITNAPKGRFYHLYELDSVCPEGWKVSTKEDWLSYMNYLIENSSDTTLMISEHDMDEIVEIDHWGRMDTFKGINPLEIGFTGWMEGGNWETYEAEPPYNANFWVMEPGRDELDRTHVHINKIRMRIHWHKHHLKPKQEKKIRQFMVRCVKQ